MALFCYRWGNANIPWNLADWTWSECQLIADIIQGFGGAAAPNFPAWLKEDTREEEKRKRFIRLLCKVEDGAQYDETKEVKTDIVVKARDVEMVIKAVAGIDVTITEE
jgi:hypothetical protein